MEVIEKMTLLKEYGVDLIVLISFLIAGYIGYQRSYRFSLMQFILQIVSIIVAYFVAHYLTAKAMIFVPQDIQISLLVPDSLYYLFQPHEDILISLIVFITCFVFSFVIIKSFLYVFSRNYEWEKGLFSQLKINDFIERVGSVLFTILHAYTYVIVFLMIVSFPLLGLVDQHSISYMLLKVAPFISGQLTDFYLPYDALAQALVIYGDEANELFDGTTVHLDKMAELILKNPSRRTELQEAYNQLVPYIATTSGYLSGFSNENKINKEEMESYLERMKDYIEQRILTLENFNYYYEELIRNETYDRLVKSETIDQDALMLLVNSGLLNEANKQKIKEYIILD